MASGIDEVPTLQAPSLMCARTHGRAEHIEGHGGQDQQSKRHSCWTGCADLALHVESASSGHSCGRFWLELVRTMPWPEQPRPGGHDAECSTHNGQPVASTVRSRALFSWLGSLDQICPFAAVIKPPFWLLARTDGRPAGEAASLATDLRQARARKIAE
jgi:hypothetical protein